MKNTGKSFDGSDFFNSIVKRVLFKKSIVVVDIDENRLKILENEWGLAGRRVTYLACLKFGSPDEAVRTLSKVVRDAGIDKRQVLMCVARNLVTVRVLQVPSTDPREVEEIVGFQVSKQTPYAKEEVCSSFKILDTYKDGYAKVLLVVVKRDILLSRLQILRQSGIEVDKLTVSSEGVYNWFNFAYPVQAHNENECPIVLIDIDSNYSDFVVIQGGKLVFTRSILIGADFFLDDKDPHMGRFVEEIKYSIDIYRRESGSDPIKKIFLSGASACFEKLRLILNEGLGIAIDTINITRNIRTGIGADILKTNRMGMVSMTALFGIAIKPADLGIDLIPSEARIQRLIDKKRRKLTITGILITSIIMMLSLLILIHVYNKTAYLQRLKQKIAEMQKESDRVEKMRFSINLARSRVNANGSSLNILHEIYCLTPSDVFFSTIDIAEGNKVVLKGSASNLSEVFKFIKKLEDSVFFMNVKSTYATNKRGHDGDYADFEIIAVLEEGEG